MDSFIEIELFQNHPYLAGNVLYGTVHLYCKENIADVKQVSLTLLGEEQVYVHLPESKGGPVKPVTKTFSIVSQKFVLFNYDEYENVILQGQFSYPFTLYLPDWLP